VVLVHTDRDVNRDLGVIVNPRLGRVSVDTDEAFDHAHAHS
jgi:hypothetical protein